MKDIGEFLSTEIESAIQQIVEASHAAAQQALDRALGRGSAPRRRARPRPASGRRGYKKRSTQEVSALAEQFYSAVCERPGQTIGVLADALELPTAQLRASVSVLRRGGRVRTVGNKQHTRYFPVDPEGDVQAAVSNLGAAVDSENATML